MTNNQAGEGIQLSTTPVHFAAGGGATTIGDFTFDPPGFEAYISVRTTAEDPGRLVFVEHSAESWGMWECHPAGDEMVIVISGVAQFMQEIDGAGHPVWSHSPKVAFAALVEFGGSGGRTSGPLAKRIAGVLLDVLGPDLEIDARSGSFHPSIPADRVRTGDGL